MSNELSAYEKKSIFDIIKLNISARQVADHYGIVINRNGMCRCPFHNDKHPSMKIDKDVSGSLLSGLLSA